MKKLYIVITTVLEKEQIDPFSFIVVKNIILQLLYENFIISMT